MQTHLLSGCAVLALLGCGESFTPAEAGPGGGDSTSAAGGTTTDNVAGCADGKRELFRDEDAAPSVAGCAGAFDVPGVTSVASRSPACDRQAGNDGDNRSGVGCSVADLCAAGWHVCESLAEIEVSLCADDGKTPSFFVTRVSTATGTLMCEAGSSDNLVGCGAGVGDAPAPPGACSPLNTVLIFSLCDDELSAWDCGTASDVEAEVVKKATSEEGGALCCRDR